MDPTANYSGTPKRRNGPRQTPRQKRERKKTVQTSEKCKKKSSGGRSTDEETENATMLLTEIYDDFDFVEKINTPLLDKLNKEPDLGDFVLTEFMDKRKKKHRRHFFSILGKNRDAVTNTISCGNNKTATFMF
ncbi:hypothetical protein QE152_g39480 [Popillia japonica]|uniref:Uncharacterized protein n=1 Tax=Popillia japonica TaxID=7064 RepID=A0AAW1HTT4_POPJA